MVAAPDMMGGIDSGSYVDPETMKMQRQLAMSLLNRGTETGPVGHPTQAIARGLQGAQGGWAMGKNMLAARANEAATQKALGDLMPHPAGQPPPQAAQPAVPGAAQPGMQPHPLGMQPPQMGGPSPAPGSVLGPGMGQGINPAGLGWNMLG